MTINDELRGISKENISAYLTIYDISNMVRRYRVDSSGSE
jgi:hypothetical protein